MTAHLLRQHRARQSRQRHTLPDDGQRRCGSSASPATSMIENELTTTVNDVGIARHLPHSSVTGAPRMEQHRHAVARLREKESHSVACYLWHAVLL